MVARQYESIESAAERLDVNPRTIRRRIADGSITGYRIGHGRSIRVDTAEVDERLLTPIPTGGAA
jgi:excisionase family DNA binding protein